MTTHDIKRIMQPPVDPVDAWMAAIALVGFTVIFLIPTLGYFLGRTK